MLFFSFIVFFVSIYIFCNIFDLGIWRWINSKIAIDDFFYRHLCCYPVGFNLNFWYVFGALAMVSVLIQYLSGLWLLMYYTPTEQDAFNSVAHIMRDVPYGWLIRYIHAVGASFLFVVLYCHIFRSLLYGSYKNPRELVWLIGIALLLLFMAEAYTGYVLPWGQMSFWAVKVILSLFSVIPWIGDTMVVWLQGDYDVSGVTLHRFFAFHVVGFSFIIIFMVCMHIIALHSVGSNNPDGIDIMRHKDKKGWPLDGVRYYPYYVLKYIPVIFLYLFLLMFVVFYIPSFYGLVLEPDNFAPANRLVTPLHIKPAWYLSPFYAILRSIPDKALGAFFMLLSILLWAFLPWIDTSVAKSMRYRGFWSRFFLSSMVISFISLGILGQMPSIGWYLFFSRFFSCVYFMYFLFLPIVGCLEKHIDVPERIGR